MSDHPLRNAIVQLVGMQQVISELTRAADDGWRLRLVQRRRELSERFTEIFGIAAGLSQSLGTPAGMALREALSRLRTALAEHQALWPAVAIDLNDPAYHASRSHLRDLYSKLKAALNAWERTLPGPGRNEGNAR